MYKVLTLALLLIISRKAFGQQANMDTSASSVRFHTRTTIQVNILRTTAGVQHDFGGGWVGSLEAGPGFGYGSQIGFFAPGRMAADIRFYPFLKNGLERDKELRNFSGFYAVALTSHPFRKSLEATSYSTLIFANDIASVGVGFQRSFLKYGYFNIAPSFGLAYYSAVKDFMWEPTGQWALGFYIPMKNKVENK